MLRSLLLLSTFLFLGSAHAQFLKDKKNIQKQQGYFTMHYDASEDKLYLEVPRVGEEFLYVHSLRSGLGSNDIGLDRGQLGGTAIVKFQKAGNKLLLIQPNQEFRALTDNELERKSIEEAFAKSVLGGFEIKETEGETYLIDFTPFLIRDAHGVADRLKRQKEGTYKLSKDKSALAMERTKAFPKNTEFEALITFEGDPTGRNIRSVAPDPQNISVIQHHSFVELPEAGFEPRPFDPRSGAIATSFMDYATPVQESIVKRFANRHRLVKRNPGTPQSEAVEPIIYYLDPGTPEPVRSALLEGARWWNQAFEAAGFIDGFQVKMLPDGADMMDLRYNVINWVHRSTRGWSYGASVVDPRTGEILKGHVSLGSLRIRQDFLIAQALMNKPFAERDDNYEPMLEMALARIRQLSAHEVGHTLGFAHNFAASPTGRASVMDYPHPTLQLKGKEVDFSNAYATGIGEWDKVTVAYSYGEVPPGQTEKDYLNSVIETAEQRGLRYITDSDARAAGGAHATAHLWDNGASAPDELDQVMKLRKQAIANFSLDNIRDGEPFTVLEDVFVPLYFYHRYQTEAAVKSVGGLNYNYAVKGDERITAVETLDRDQQEEALKSVLATLTATQLAIPQDKLQLFPPRAYGYGRTRESFKGTTGVSFDPLGAASTASDMTLGLLFHPERVNRLVVQKARDSKQLGLKEVLGEVDKSTLQNLPRDSYDKEIQQTINYNVLKHYINLAASEEVIPQARALVSEHLLNLAASFKGGSAQERYMALQIERYMEEPDKFKVIPSPKIPDGSPIGTSPCTLTE
ncbi:zinc-dependent metalloprotease [Croceiramulus getboli]|nr:zinc-dependent metalloprotease [Flavobacteriaceae bacterium YJPT1-3]